MIFALAVALAAPADCVPVRWNSHDVESLGLVRGTAVNCLLVERSHWSREFSAKAGESGVAVLGLVSAGMDIKDSASAAGSAGLAGLVWEGAGAGAEGLAKETKLPVIEMGPRTRMKLDGPAAVVATHQGVWPGINEAEEGEAKAAPSGAPWIDTNTGFLRFVRSVTRQAVWIGNKPPAGKVFPVARYLQAIGDAEIVGAHWVVALDADLDGRLHAGERGAVADWKKITDLLGYFASHKEWREMEAYGKLAIVQDVESGGLISGGILDMISVKHTPVKPVAGRQLKDQAMQGSKMAVNVDPSALSDEQKEVLRRFTRSGGTLLTAPSGWKFPPQKEDQITLAKEDVEKLDQIWKEVNSMTGRHNLGARLFNVSSMLSHMAGTGDGKRLVLHLVNYSDYPVEAVTVHILGKYTKVKLLAPGEPERPLAPFEIEDGTGVEIDRAGSVATLIIE